MNTSFHNPGPPSGSAKIYQFPQRPRAAASPSDISASAKPIVTSGWYHDAAIQDAKPTTKL